MPEKGYRGQSKTEERLIQSRSDTVSSNPTSTTADLPSDNSSPKGDSHNDGGTATKTTQPRNSQSRKKRKSTSAHLQTIGLIAAIVAIPLAYWQGRMQSSHSEFERNQRVVELSLDLASFWETQLDPDTRYRVGRFIAKLRLLETEEERNFLVTSMLDPKNLVDSNSVLQNKLLRELIEPDLSSDNPDNSKMAPVIAVARYKAAIMRVLNTMEAVAIVREHSKESPEAIRVLDRAYAGTIQQRYKQLTPFLVEYRKQNSAGREIPAWEPLSKMVEEKDRDLSQATEEKRR